MPSTIRGNTDYQTALLQAQRQQKLAEALRQQSFQPIESADSGALKAPVSWTQGLSKMLQGYAANKVDQNATQNMADASTSKNQALADTLKGAFSPVPGQPEQHGPFQDGLVKPAVPGREKTSQEISQALLANPDTMELGSKMMIEGVNSREKMSSALAQSSYEHQLKNQAEIEKSQRDRAWFLDPERIGTEKEIKAAGRTQIHNVIGAAEKAGAVEMAKVDAKDLGIMRDDALKSMQGLEFVRGMKSSMNDPAGVYSGAFAEGRAGVANFMETLGVPGIDINKLANTQKYNNYADQAAAAILKSIVGSQQISNTDVKFVKSMFPRLEMQPAARAELLNFLEQRLNDKVTMYKNADKQFRETNKLDGLGFVPTPETSAPSGLSRIRFDSQGKRLP